MAISPVNVSCPPLRLATAFHAPGFVLSCEFLSLETPLSAGFPQLRIYWGMDRVIFDESAADWTIPLR
jgi:hypothetical protein